MQIPQLVVAVVGTMWWPVGMGGGGDNDDYWRMAATISLTLHWIVYLKIAQIWRIPNILNLNQIWTKYYFLNALSKYNK